MIHEGGGEKEKREMDQLCSPDGKEEEERGKSSTTGRGRWCGGLFVELAERTSWYFLYLSDSKRGRGATSPSVL